MRAATLVAMARSHMVKTTTEPSLCGSATCCPDGIDS